MKTHHYLVVIGLFLLLVGGCRNQPVDDATATVAVVVSVESADPQPTLPPATPSTSGDSAIVTIPLTPFPSPTATTLPTSTPTPEPTILPSRAGPAAVFASDIPHKQLNAELDEVLRAELLRRAYLLPHIEQRGSMTGGDGLWLSAEIEAAHPEAFVLGREIGHIHIDGSLHLVLPKDVAREAVLNGWSARHPCTQNAECWFGFVLVTTPRTPEEVETLFKLIVDSYNFIVGTEYESADFE